MEHLDLNLPIRESTDLLPLAFTMQEGTYLPHAVVVNGDHLAMKFIINPVADSYQLPWQAHGKI